MMLMFVLTAASRLARNADFFSSAVRCVCCVFNVSLVVFMDVVNFFLC